MHGVSEYVASVWPVTVLVITHAIYCVRCDLQGEHGTGRNMAPFVEMEWGSRASVIMRRIKALFDPQHLLNPGVILNEVRSLPWCVCVEPGVLLQRMASAWVMWWRCALHMAS